MMVSRGPSGSAPSISGRRPWSTISASTSRWNAAASASSTRPARSCGRPRSPASPRRWPGSAAARPGDHQDRARGRAAVAVAPCRPGQGRVRRGAARDPPGQGGALRHDGENGPQGRPRHRSAAADGLVPAGPLQGGADAGDPGPAHRAQAPAGQAARCRARHPRPAARLRPQGRHRQQGPLRGADPGADRRPADARAGDRADAARAGGAEHRVPRAAPGHARHRAGGRGLPAPDDGARRRRAGGDHLHLGGRRPDALRRARAVGAHFGLTPKRYQSGETDIVGGSPRSATAWSAPRCTRRPTSC